MLYNTDAQFGEDFFFSYISRFWLARLARRNRYEGRLELFSNDLQNPAVYLNWRPISVWVHKAGLPNPWPAKLFCVAPKVFLRDWFPFGKAYLAVSGKYKGLNQNLLFVFPEISTDLRRRPFFLDLDLLFGTDSRNTGRSEQRFCTTKLQLFGV